MSNNDINYDAAIDEALKEAARNESENEASIVTELEPDPVAAVQEETVQEEVEAPDLGQYFPEVHLPVETPAEGEETASPETQEGLQEEGTAEEMAPESLEETDPPSVEERLDDMMDLLGGLQELLKQLVGNMEAQSKSIDSIGARVIDAVTTLMQHSGAKVAPVKPPAPAVEKEEASEKGPSEAERANFQTIQALKERRS